MVDERRRSPRARIAGARVHCETPSGDRVSGRGVDLGRGGVFVQSADSLPVGKHVTLEIQIPGELAPWSAVGRVVWTRRHDEGGGLPAGLGIAFIDVDDAVLAAIGRLLARAPEAPPSRRPPDGAPSRERTVLGVGLPEQAPVAMAPILSAAPARERTVLGIAPATQPSPASEPPPQRVAEAARAPEIESASDLPDWPDEPPEPEPVSAPEPPKPEKAAQAAMERSVPIDLVAKATPDSRPPPRQLDREPSLSVAGLPRRGRGGRWLFVLLVALGATGYAMRARIHPWVAPYLPAAMFPTPIVASPSTPATVDLPPATAAPATPPSASASPGAVETAAQSAPAPSALRAASGDAGADAGRAMQASPPGSALPAPSTSAHRPPPPVRRPGPATPTPRPSADNPYE
jgi:uncharacterized protein (TIGR02266 family)